jgi:hypothetical protein
MQNWSGQKSGQKHTIVLINKIEIAKRTKAFFKERLSALQVKQFRCR